VHPTVLPRYSTRLPFLAHAHTWFCARCHLDCQNSGSCRIADGSAAFWITVTFFQFCGLVAAVGLRHKTVCAIVNVTAVSSGLFFRYTVHLRFSADTHAPHTCGALYAAVTALPVRSATDTAYVNAYRTGTLLRLTRLTPGNARCLRVCTCWRYCAPPFITVAYARCGWLRRSAACRTLSSFV